MGYSAGSRSKPAFDWVKNLSKRKDVVAAADKLNYDGSSTFALFWNMVKVFVPEEIVNDYTTFIEDNKLHRMDANQRLMGDRGAYRMQIGDEMFHFKAELAPPAGVYGENYSRYEQMKYCTCQSLIYRIVRYITSTTHTSGQCPGRHLATHHRAAAATSTFPSTV